MTQTRALSLGAEQRHRANNGGKCHTIAENRAAMGIDWMNREELSQAIPPAYSEYLCSHILAEYPYRERPLPEALTQ